MPQNDNKMPNILKKILFSNPNICSYSFIRYETTFCENILFLSGQKSRFEKIELNEIVELPSKFVKLLFRIDFSVYKTEFSRSVTEKQLSEYIEKEPYQ